MYTSQSWENSPQSIGMIESMEREEEEVRGEISLYTNESLVAIVRMEFRTVIKPIGVTSVSIGGLLTHSFSFLFLSYLVIHHEMAVWKRYIFLQHSHIVLCCYLRQLIFLFSFSFFHDLFASGAVRASGSIQQQNNSSTQVWPGIKRNSKVECIIYLTEEALFSLDGSQKEAITSLNQFYFRKKKD